MIASEAQPFSKTGGLADVATALPKALGRLGHEVTLDHPALSRHRPTAAVVDRASLEMAGHRFSRAPDARSRSGPARACCCSIARRSTIAPGIYNDARWRLRRQRRALRVPVGRRASTGRRSKPEPFDIVHAHDWQAGLAPVYPAPALRLRADAATVPTVFTIHNLAYQGVFDKAGCRGSARLGRLHVSGFEFCDRLSFLKAGVNFADAMTTVSPTYAEEIQRPEYGYGFDGVIRDRGATRSSAS